MVKAVPVSGFAGTRKQIDKLCADAEVLSGNKAYWVRVDGSGELVGGIAKFLAPMKDALISALGLAPDTLVAFAAGKNGRRAEDRRRAHKAARRALPGAHGRGARTPSAG